MVRRWYCSRDRELPPLTAISRRVHSRWIYKGWIRLSTTYRPLGSPLLAGTLYEVSPRDLPTIIIIPAIMFFVTLLAAYVPAQHAMRLDPVAALRCE